jgi:hypothetical protein
VMDRGTVAVEIAPAQLHDDSIVSMYLAV